MPALTLVVTGTDTGVGKTRIACELIRLARGRRIKVCGFKPVATGCAATADGLRNDDALALQQAAGTGEPYEVINPYAFEPAVAPHLAASSARRQIRPSELNRVHADLATRYRLIVLEGAGGWHVPLDDTWTFGAWVAEREWPVLLVVGMRLGCLNHALLTAEAIGRETRLAGWVANVLGPPMERLEENIDALARRLAAPCWGVFPADGTAFAGTGAVESSLERLLAGAAAEEEA